MAAASSSLRNLGRVLRNRALNTVNCGPVLDRLAGRGRSRSAVAKSIRTIVEALETRQLMSVLPAPDVSNWQSLSGTASTVGGNEYNTAPSTAVDPTNPLNAVTVWQFNNPSANGDQKIFIRGSYTTDGSTWQTFTLPGTLMDPVASASSTRSISYADATDATVGFDRNGHFYVAYSEHSADNSSGAIVLQSFDLSGGTPSPVVADKVVYQWANADFAWSPTLAVDNNLSTAFTDPVSGVVTPGDTQSGNIYIAWASQDTRPTSNPTVTAANFNANTLVFTASHDAGSTFTAPMTWNSNGHNGGTGSIAAASPKIAVAGDGTVDVVWDDVNGGRARSTPQDDIYLSQTGSGTGQQVTDNTIHTIRDAGPVVFGPTRTLNLHVPQDATSQPTVTLTGLFDGDSRLDAVVLNTVSGDVTFLQGNGNGTFRQGPTITTSTAGATPIAMEKGDFDGDNKLDLMVVDSAGVNFLKGLGTGAFAAPVQIFAGTGLTSIAAAQLDTGSVLDFVVTDGTNNQVQVVMNSGGAPTAPAAFDVFGPLPADAASNPVGVAIADMDGDGNMDLVTANAGSDNISVLLGSGTGTFATPAANTQTIYAVGTGVTAVKVGTLNGDTQTDVAVLYSGGVATFLNQTAGPAFDMAQGAGIASNPGESWTSIALLDVVGNNSVDVLITDAANNQLLVGVGDGAGGFNRWASSFVLGAGPMGISTGDFDGASGADVIVANSGDGTATVLMHSTANGPGVTDIPVAVNVSDSTFSLSNLEVMLRLTHANTEQLQIQLIAPNGLGTFNLVLNRVNAANVAIANPATNRGIAGINMGYVPGTAKRGLYTIFDDQAARNINDTTAAAEGYVGRFMPEPSTWSAGTFAALLGSNDAAITGSWTLRITDFVSNTSNGVAPVQTVDSWGLLFSSGATATAENKVTSTTVLGAVNGTFPRASGSSGVTGIGPGAVVAVDSTLGSFSPHQGRIYVAYVNRDSNAAGNPSDNTDVMLRYSDDGGVNWSGANRVNDDLAATDGYSEAVGAIGTLTTRGRPQFQPALAVDQFTGTLVVTFYDARRDVARTLVTRYIATSIDGGQTFGPQTYLNQPYQVMDAITGRQITVGPIADNGSLNVDPTYGNGNSQGLAVLGGHVYATWSGNENGSTDGRRLPNILTATTTIAAGPRVVSGTMGLVASGTLSSFTITFDRPIDPNTITAGNGGLGNTFGNVKLFFRDPVSGIISPVATQDIVTPLDLGTYGATMFRIDLVAPDTRTGTFLYLVGPDSNGAYPADQIRHDALTPGNEMDQNSNALAGEAPVVGLTDGDMFGIPTPTTDGTFDGTFFSAPFDISTLPLIIAGPHVTTPLADGLTLNGTVSYLDVTFDRAMDKNSIYDSSATADANGAYPVLPGVVVGFAGPLGPVAGPITALVQDAGTDTIFRFFFPKQTISGDYRLILGANLKSRVDVGGETMDGNQDAGLDGLMGTNPVSNRPVTYPSASGTTVSVAAGATDSLPLTVDEAFLIQGARVRVNVSTTDTRAVDLTLVFDDGTTVTRIPLAVGAGGGAVSANFINTLFDDLANTPVANGAGPFYGSFNPQQSLLAALGGLNAKGTWSLEVTNHSTTATATINGWSLILDKPTFSTGLGTGPADQTTVGFRIFTMDPSNTQSSNTWTAVGPAAAGDNSGRIGGLAVDPSDPSGNTVFAAGASGGIWKTTNFLTSDPTGPTWLPLTDFGPTTALNTGSLAVFGRNGNPSQSVVIVATGEGDTQAENFGVPSPGVGFLLSLDGGSTWTVLDSLVNVDSSGNLLPLSARTHDFVGTSGFKVAVDPRPTPNGDVIIYAAMSNGLYRSADTGKTWTRLKAGKCTDVVLDPNSGYTDAFNNPTGNLDIVYAAFQGFGVYMSSNRGQTWALMTGGLGNPLQRDGDVGGGLNPVPVNNNAASNSPNGSKGRIVLAKPDLSGVFLPDGTYTGNPAWDVQYQGWVYAMVATSDNKLDGLYMTKDFGQNWTKVRIPSDSTISPVPSNDPGNADWNLLDFQGNYDMAIAVDPTNPSIVYIAGQENNVLRVDTTFTADPHAMFIYDSVGTGGLTVNSGNTVSIKNAINPPGLNGQVPAFNTYDPINNPMINLLRDPFDPFGVASTVYLRNVSAFSNSGAGGNWKVFSDYFDGGDYHEFITIRDPLTGKARLIVGNDHVVATVVDNDGQYLTDIGGTSVVAGPRTGNLQISQFYYGAVQPSNLAAQIAGARFYGSAQDDGAPTSGDPSFGEDPINDGFINWTGGMNEGDTGGVAVDQQGTGTLYQYKWPCCGGDNTDFFQVDGVGRTYGLLQAGDDPNNKTGQWPKIAGANFAINPINSSQIVLGSSAGRIFTTSNQGVFWTVLANPTDLDSSQANAFAFGAPIPGGTTALNSFIYVGTEGGHVYMTSTGGGLTQLGGALSGSVRMIVASPTRGSHEVYAITTNAVYHMEDSSAPGAAWTNITGDLFSHQINAFGDANLTTNALGTGTLSSMAADWRYNLPDATGTHPVLYAAGLGGVFRSLDDGAHWTPFPNQAVDAAPADGGYMPVVQVTDLDFALGAINPTTGYSDVSGGPSLLVATTYGRGTFAIRVAPLVFSPAFGQDTGLGQRTITGQSQIAAYGNTLTFNAYDATDPTNLIPISLVSATVNPDGTFKLTLPANLAATKVAFQAVDGAGVVGPMSTLLVPPATPSAPDLVAADDTGVSNSDDLTGRRTPTINDGGNLLPVGNTVTVYVNGATVGSPVTVDAGGHWSFTLPNALTDGVYSVTITQTDAQNQTSAQSPALTITIDGTGPTGAANPVPGATANSPIAPYTVATFTDAHKVVSATINWGDGTGPVTIPNGSPANGGTFNVVAGHTYASAGTYTVSITATDDAGNTTTVTKQALVAAPAYAFGLTGQALNPSEGSVFNGRVAIVNDGNLSHTAANLAATINWGDGTTSAGTVVAGSIAGTFNVLGTHTYLDDRQDQTAYDVTVTVNTTDGKTGTIGSVADVSNVIPTGTVSDPGAIYLGQSVTLTLTASDASPADVAAGFDYVINWGDGTQDVIARTPGNGAGITRTHTFNSVSSAITVSISDKDASRRAGTRVITKPITVSSAPALNGLAVVNGDGSRSDISQIQFNVSNTGVAGGVSLSDIKLYYNGDGVNAISLAGASLAFDQTTGAGVLDLSHLTTPLRDGDYQLQITVAGKLLPPISFFKLQADVTGDGKVDAKDLALINKSLGKSSGQAGFIAAADLNHDGVVNSTDVAIYNKNKNRKATGGSASLILQTGKAGTVPTLDFGKVTVNTNGGYIDLVLKNANANLTELKIGKVTMAGAGFSFAFPGLAWGPTSANTVLALPAGKSVAIRVYLKSSAKAQNLAGKLKFSFATKSSGDYKDVTVPVKATIVAATAAAKAKAVKKH